MGGQVGDIAVQFGGGAARGRPGSRPLLGRSQGALGVPVESMKRAEQERASRHSSRRNVAELCNEKTCLFRLQVHLFRFLHLLILFRFFFDTDLQLTSWVLDFLYSWI